MSDAPHAQTPTPTAEGPCLVCSESAKELLLDLGAQPVASHFHEAGAVPERYPLALMACRACGQVQLRRPFPAAALAPRHSWLSYREPEKHLDAAMTTLARSAGTLDGKRALGLSPKDETMLARLQRAGVASAEVISASRDLGASGDHAGVETIQHILTSSAVSRLVSERGPFDIVIARHIAEHAERPRDFLRAVVTLLAPGGIVMFEAPDSERNLRLRDYAMIWEEHTLYFTERTFKNFSEHLSLHSLDITRYPFAFEDVFVLFARKSEEQQKSSPTRRDVADDSELKLARRYGEAFDEWSDKIRSQLRSWRAEGWRIALYGAGHLSAAFVNFHQVADCIDLIVDDTDAKQGLCMPGLDLEIRPSSALYSERRTLCLLGLSPDIEPRIAARHREFIEGGSRFLSVICDSRLSIRSEIASSAERSALAGSDEDKVTANRNR